MAETNVGHLASREGTGATRAAQHVLRNEPFIARLHVQLDKVRAKLAAERHASTLLDGVQRQQHLRRSTNTSNIRVRQRDP